MITPISSPTTLVTCLGRVEKVCRNFYSTRDLTNSILKLDYGYLSPTTQSSGFVYQSQYVSGQMSFVGSTPNTECIEVELIVLDNHNFQIFKTFLVSTPHNDWASNAISNNANFLTQGGQGDLVLRVEGGANSEGTCAIPVKINGCEHIAFGELVFSKEEILIPFTVDCPANANYVIGLYETCLLYTSPSPRDRG